MAQLREISNLKVVVRVRPFIQSDSDSNNVNEMPVLCVASPSEQVLEISGDKSWTQLFSFDRVYWSHDQSQTHFATQATLYEELGCELLEHAFEGFNTCLITYGQTASGSSFSMLGADTDESRGLLPRMVHGIYDKFDAVPAGTSCYCKISCMEMYNEQIYDLLSTAPRNKSSELQLRQHPRLGHSVSGLIEKDANSCTEALQIMAQGISHRTMGETAKNSNSNRGHSIFSFKIAVVATDGSVTLSQTHLVDLGGSERAKKTQAKGNRLKEGASINKSLSALSGVIETLADNIDKKIPQRPPFRESKLTCLLQESLVGNVRSVMVVGVSPALKDCEESLWSLRFAQSARKMRLTAKTNKMHIATKRAFEMELLQRFGITTRHEAEPCMRRAVEERLKQLPRGWNQEDAVSVVSFNSLACFISTSSAASCTSHLSAISETHCYVPGTVVMDMTGRFIPLEQLQAFDLVRGASGQPLRVTSITIHSADPRKLVTLRADTASLVVTDSHRIMILRGGKEVAAPAGTLRVGDDIVCGHGIHKLTDVQLATECTEVLEISFHPDEPVEVFNMPTESILTKGFRAFKSRRGGRQRRCHATQDANDQTSIPSTFDPWE